MEILIILIITAVVLSCWYWVRTSFAPQPTTYIVNQRNCRAGGDIVGRDKYVR